MLNIQALPSDDSPPSANSNQLPNAQAMRLGYTIQPIGSKDYLVPTILTEENFSLAAVEVPYRAPDDIHTAGVSHLPSYSLVTTLIHPDPISLASANPDFGL